MISITAKTNPRTLNEQQKNLHEKFQRSKPERTRFYKSQMKVRWIQFLNFLGSERSQICLQTNHFSERLKVRGLYFLSSLSGGLDSLSLLEYRHLMHILCIIYWHLQNKHEFQMIFNIIKIDIELSRRWDDKRNWSDILQWWRD